MWNKYWTVTNIEEALDILAREREKARIIAGGTDLVLELKHGAHSSLDTLVDVSRIDLGEPIYQDADGVIHIQPTATHNHCVISPILQNNAFLLSQASYSIGTPQIRNMGTIFGNVVTASPANDTITPLVALDAQLVLRSKNNSRHVALRDFYQGVRRIDLHADEMVTDIYFQPLQKNQRSIFVKFILRKIHAISVVNVAIILTLDGDDTITKAVVTLGAVAPTIIHAVQCEEYLMGKKLSGQVIKQAALLAAKNATPITDIRSSDAYRSRLVAVLTENGLTAIASGNEKREFPDNPVLLWGKHTYEASHLKTAALHADKMPIETTINGSPYELNTFQDKTLLKLIREGAGLTGSKLGCGEGECGACTMLLDGIPVLSCLIPAPRAHGAEVQTIEGVARDGNLHPIQQAYVEEGAVQCGFCTPGFIMSTLKLLEEFPDPSREEIEVGLAGNICRCTGYYSIINAVEKAAEIMAE
ncbi:MAG: oxidoreductase [Anaerolinea thermophila]|uniref:Oxidoreductase n=1 Tax=Anaerolinea thermophila TaxID=167964 RepID=A0A101FYQ5_9CHLR|nr:MAG: oxidoreductase [Anaerolinea thermophila]